MLDELSISALMVFLKSTLFAEVHVCSTCTCRDDIRLCLNMIHIIIVVCRLHAIRISFFLKIGCVDMHVYLFDYIIMQKSMTVCAN